MRRRPPILTRLQAKAPTWALALLLALGVGGVGHLAHATLEHGAHHGEESHACCSHGDHAPPTSDSDGEEDPLDPHGEDDCQVCHLAFSTAKVAGDEQAVGIEQEFDGCEPATLEERDVAPSRWLTTAPPRGPPIG